MARGLSAAVDLSPDSYKDPGDLGLLIGQSRAMRRVRRQLAAIAARPWPARLEGERGTGKNLAARYLHRLMKRPEAPFVEGNIAAISAGAGRELGELVGWRRGAFTGAVYDQPGLLEQAHGGIAFLNELGTASPDVQLALLRLMEERRVYRLGDSCGRLVRVRIVVATNEDLERAVRRGSFRRDLYDRLGLLLVEMPPLRDRIEDIPQLVSAIMVRKAKEAEIEPSELRPLDLDPLMTYSWPGNVRELEIVLEYVLTFGRLPPRVTRAVGRSRSWRPQVDEELARHGGNKSQTARALGVARSTLLKELAERAASRTE
ncbi:MAG: sigma-54-dependent Fis family transcriptional regulator [Gemmatimonadetes bacterium]|nr:sigma-54-dependent Fis family transcriptional regulator [Gemmatimonadota bacterium]